MRRRRTLANIRVRGVVDGVNTPDIVVIVVVFAILAACLAVDAWVRRQ